VKTYQIQWSLVRNILYSSSFDKVLIFAEKLSGQTQVSGISPGLDTSHRHIIGMVILTLTYQ
jgi:hypothetical protein